MMEPLLLLAISLLIGLASLAVAVWLVVTGRVAYLDGLSLALICLAVGAVFLSMVGWSYHTSELKAILESLRKRKNAAPGS